MRPRSRSARATASVLAAVFGLVLSARPVQAEPSQPSSSQPRAASVPAEAPVSAAAAARVAALTPAELASVSAQATDTAAPTTSNPSFFKTGKGIAVLVLLVAGVGYASYSAVDDRKPVKSPIR